MSFNFFSPSVKLRIWLLPIALFSLSIVSAQAQISIPDQNFLDKLIDLGIDTNGDGVIQEIEALVPRDIDVSRSNIESLEGIQYFVNLERLACFFNSLTELNVSSLTKLKNLGAGYNQITSLDVSNLTELETLDVDGNRLPSLDVSNSLKLKYLFCERNGQIEELLLGTVSSIKELRCAENKLTNLDLSNLSELELLEFYRNRIETIDLSENNRLKKLMIYENEIKSLDLSHNPLLEELDFMSNEVTEIDLGNNLLVQKLNCSLNQLSTLELSQQANLFSLDCSGNNLTTLRLGFKPALKELYADNNPFSYLDMGGVDFNFLSALALDGVHLESVCVPDVDLASNREFDIGGFPDGVTIVNCDYISFPDQNLFQALIDRGVDLNGNGNIEHSEAQEVTALDISGLEIADLRGLNNFTNLEELNINDNNLSTLNLSGMSQLKVLHADDNVIVSFALGTHENLEFLSLMDNGLICLNMSGINWSSLNTLLLSGNEYLNSICVTDEGEVLRKTFTQGGIPDQVTVYECNSFDEISNCTGIPYVQSLEMNCSQLPVTRATIWEGERVAIAVEGERPGDRDYGAMRNVVKMFDSLYRGLEDLSGIYDLPVSPPMVNGKPVIQILQDNCGAGGLAGHGAAGSSYGIAFLDEQYNSILEPRIHQIFIYEQTRNFWLPSNLNKIDWIMDESDAVSGFWTNGFTGFTPYVLPTELGYEVNYFGWDLELWYDRHVGYLRTYVDNRGYTFENTWKSSLFPWSQWNSINDMMSGLLIYFYDIYGYEFAQKVYRNMQNPEIPDLSSKRDYQGGRDNIYKIFSLSSKADQLIYFQDTLRWDITTEAQAWIADQSLQYIAFEWIEDKTEADEPFELIASASSGLEVTLSSSDPSIISIDDNIATIHGIGEVEIMARQAGDENNQPTFVSQRVVVQEADLVPRFVLEDHFEVEENSQFTLSLSDLEIQSGEFRWTLKGEDADQFVLDGENLILQGELDYENPSDGDQDGIYWLEVEVSDASSSFSQFLRVNMLDQDEAPEFNVGTELSVEENTVEIVVPVATDPEGGDLSWTLSGADASLFEIEGAYLKFSDAADYEAPSDADQNGQYEVELTVSDGTFDVSQSMTVTVTNQNESPEFDLDSEVSIEENTTAIVELVATDPEGDNLSWTLSGADALLFEIEGTNLKFTDAADYEIPSDADQNGQYEVGLTVSDGTFDVNQSVTVTVTNQNESPEFDLDSEVSIEENTTAIVKLIAIDPEGDNLSWALSGADASLFEIEGTNLKFIEATDFEAPSDADQNGQYEVEVTVSDGSLDTNQSVTITVINQNEAPSIDIPRTTSLEGDVVEVLELFANDPENDDLSFTLSGADASFFTIKGSILNFQSLPSFHKPLDENGDNSYELEISVSDGEYSASVNLTVIVTVVTSIDPLRPRAVIKLYPNPASDRILIDAPLPIDKLILIYPDGKKYKVYEGANEIDLRDVKEGYYLLKVELEDGSSYTERLIVSR
ncbi:hypothetical protein BFP97_02310 [Roseivirga sp. 4D4]|uniref:Ig-like domain-containing protein n=1 Tax=Roseivirga sp. 4D4 TaxID=1889784 RepID=UPI000853CCA9|nr:Ig-like domain-containing protein [Roseivirga sp. 4D4]OEK00417.1 hypothetical protein BFP97_02310 [Roseivirga sp. 4D4]